MRALTAYLAVAIGALQCPGIDPAVATVWTATKVHGEVHGEVHAEVHEKQQHQVAVGDRKPSEDAPARGT